MNAFEVLEKTALTGKTLDILKNPLPYKVVDVDGESMAEILPIPVSYSCNMKDYVGSHAGRTEDMSYHKMLLGTYVELVVSYAPMKTDAMRLLLDALSEEYMTLGYYHPKEVAGYEEKEFYLSEKSVPMYSAALDLWSGLSLTFTQRKPDVAAGTEEV